MLQSEQIFEMIDQFMSVIESETRFPVLIYDAAGYIIRATDPSRIGDLHAGAEKIMQGLADEYAVSADEARSNPLVREGYSCPIVIDGHRVAGFGITGKLELTRPLARTAVKMIDAWLESNQYQAQLEWSEQKYRNLFDNALNGIFQATLDGRYLTANASMASIFGYASADEMIADIADIAGQLYVFPEERTQLLDTLLKKGRVAGYVAQVRRRDGCAIHVSINAQLVTNPDTGERLIEGHLEDITAKRAAEDALRLSEEKYAKAFNNSPVWVVLSAMLSGRYVEVNQAFLASMGYERDEIIGRTSLELGTWFDPGDRSRIIDCLDACGHVRNVEVKRLTKAGRVLTTLFSADIITIGGKRCLISVSQDISERKRLEETMIQSEKMLSVGGLAAGMAHEINNPLAGILQNIAVLDNRLLGDLPANHAAAVAAGTTMDAIRRYIEARSLTVMLDNIRISGQRAAAIVKNMLSFARKSEHVFSSHRLDDLLEQTLDLIRTDYDMKKSYDFKQIRIVKAYDDLLGPVPCDAGKVQQVFLNILKNGAEAMAGGTEQNGRPTFTLRVKRDGPWARVEIQDNGPGMDETTRRRVFEPFYTSKPVGMGTGLGLSVSYFIITENHRGQLRVTSTPGKGATFIIRLPLENEHTA